MPPGTSPLSQCPQSSMEALAFGASQDLLEYKVRGHNLQGHLGRATVRVTGVSPGVSGPESDRCECRCE